MMPSIVVAALYKFVSLPDYKDLQKTLAEICKKNGIKGILLLAEEGINGTVSGSRQGINALCSYLYQDSRFHELEYKESYAQTSPFLRMRVRLKKEIVTLKAPEVSPTKKVGTYVNPQKWNQLLSDPNIVLIDTRNKYEIEIGTFKGALNPETNTFGDFPQYVQAHLADAKNKKIAMYCTGGIRCEKASSYLLEQGFKEVYHLKGGILTYLEQIPEKESLWKGECFVFDHRVSVKHGLQLGSYDLCHGCRYPISLKDKAAESFKEGVYCPHCYGKRSEKSLKRSAERQKQTQLAKRHRRMHLGSF